MRMIGAMRKAISADRAAMTRTLRTRYNPIRATTKAIATTSSFDFSPQGGDGGKDSASANSSRSTSSDVGESSSG
jgi:hypothetical protein